jgi:cyclophilin family peptidyl-prolyl cis-trans isomerase
MKTLLMLAAAAAATPAIKPAPAPSEIVAAAPASDWVAIAPADLLVMDLASGKRVVIQLMPPPFSQGWVGNIRKLAAAKWWDGTSVNRVQDNYVVQWGDATEKKALPKDLVTVPESGYAMEAQSFRDYDIDKMASVTFEEIEKSDGPRKILEGLHKSDAYTTGTDFYVGWPLGGTDNAVWPVHCYGMVGVGRDMPPNTGTGAELYTVIGHAPRHLDRNIALVGRVISGIENLSSLPRGTGPLGFYEKPEERVTITSIRMGTEIKDLPRYEYLSTESASFATYADARANRRDPFFIVPAGGADICNIPVPVRVAK